MDSFMTDLDRPCRATPRGALALEAEAECIKRHIESSRNYEEEWAVLPDRLSYCTCEPCSDNKYDVAKMVALAKGNVNPKKPGDARLTITSNLLLYGASRAVEGLLNNKNDDNSSIVRLPNEILRLISVYLIEGGDAVSPIMLALTCKRMLGNYDALLHESDPALTGVLLPLQKSMSKASLVSSLNTAWSADPFAKQTLLAKLAETWTYMMKDSRVCWACYHFRWYGPSHAPRLTRAVALAMSQMSPEHQVRTTDFKQNWEVALWLGDPISSVNVSSRDERLRCPGCVLKGCKLGASKDFVDAQNAKRNCQEFLKKWADEDQVKDMVRKIAQIQKSFNGNDAGAHEETARTTRRVKRKLGTDSKAENRKATAQVSDGRVTLRVTELQNQQTPSRNIAISVKEGAKRGHRFDVECGCSECEKILLEKLTEED